MPMNIGDSTHTLHNMTFSQNTLRIHGRVLSHIPITIYDFISNTGHCRRRYTRFRQLYICPRNTLKIHGRVLWPKPVTIDDFISNSGHCRRCYTRFTLLCKCPRNTLKIHDRVLWPKPVTINDFISNSGHCRRCYTCFTLLCNCPRDTLKIHGRELWLKPVTTNGFISDRYSTEVGIWYNTHGRALPTVRIPVPSSHRISVRPNTIAQSISDQYMIV